MLLSGYPDRWPSERTELAAGCGTPSVAWCRREWWSSPRHRPQSYGELLARDRLNEAPSAEMCFLSQVGL